jgi:hypothetical protein
MGAPWLVGRLYVDTDGRREEVADWIRSLGLDPTNMDLRIAVTQRGAQYELHLSEYVLDTDGRKQIDHAVDQPYRRPVVVPIESETWPAWLAGVDDILTPQTPAYVHDIFDAFLTGRPLNFWHGKVPEDVQRRLDEAVASGRLGTVKS